MNEKSAQARLKMLLKDNTNIRRQVSKKWLIRWSRLFSYKTSDRVFSRKLDNSWKKYHLEILLDWSWSMVWWHWAWRNSAIYLWVEIVKKLVNLFEWIIEIDLYVYNLLETKVVMKTIKNFDMSKLIKDDDVYDFLWINNLKIDKTNKTFTREEWASKSAPAWNWDISSIYNSFERLSKKDWEKLMIVIWDWAMRNDYVTNSTLIDENYYINWRPCKLYNPNTAKEVCKHIVKNWVNMLWITIWDSWDFSYMNNNTHVSKNNIKDIYNISLDFIKKSFK